MAYPEEYIADELGRGNLELLTILYDVHVLTNASRLRFAGGGPLGQSLLMCITDGPGGDNTDERFNRLKSCVDFLLERGYAMNNEHPVNNAITAAIFAHRPRLALYLIDKGVTIHPVHTLRVRQQFGANLDNPYSRQLLARLTTERVRQNIPGAVNARTARRAFQNRTGLSIMSPAGRTFMQMLGGPGRLPFGNAGAGTRRRRK